MIRLFRVYHPTGVLALLFSEIILTGLCFVLAAYIVLTEDVVTYLRYDNGLVRIAIVIASIILGLHLMDLYTRIQVKSRMRLLQDLCQVFGIALMAQGLISYATPNLKFGRGIMLVGSLLSLIVLFVWRLIYSAYVLRVVGAERILFVDANPLVRSIARHILAHPEIGLSIQGYMDDNEAPGTDLIGAKVLGRIADLRTVAQEIRPGRIVLGVREQGDRLPVEDLLGLRFTGFTIEDAASTY